MRRAAVILGVFVWVCLSEPSSALAASDVQLKHAADGTLVVVGSGWHHGQLLVIDVGQQQFKVRTDTSGDFELATGLSASSGKLAVHHVAATSELAFAAIGAATPSPFAVLLAWSVAEGVALLAALTGLMLLVAGVRRRVRVSRYPRQ
jgi:hypothetical protein